MPDTPTSRAEGTFDVDLQPLPAEADWGGFARLSIDKRFHGDLDGESRGVMLAAHTAVQGSAGYAAFERVTAALDGRTGTFVLQHSGQMGAGEPRQEVTVVPDSGTDGLVGITGSMQILVEDGGHRYVFAYALPRGD